MGVVSGFRVDLDALAAVADGVRQVVAELAAHKVSDLDCKRTVFGHDKLAGTVHDFCDRWQYGVTSLTQDGGEIADRLTQSLQTYQEADGAAVDALVEVVASHNTASSGLEAV